MLLAGSALNDFSIEASDGKVGTVRDSLFDDESWRIRWLVVDTGTWLKDRKVLVHPSAIAHVDPNRQQLRVTLTKAQVEGSPNILTDKPVSRQMEARLYDYYGWDRYWGGSYFGANGIAMPFSPAPFFGAAPVADSVETRSREDVGDPHLRSLAEVKGYHLHATDGEIGHFENVLVDDANWDLRYLVIDTRNWWLGQHVLVTPHAVKAITWSDRHIQLNISRDQVKSSPPWDPVAMVDKAYEERLHSHYGWPGYGV